MKRNRQAWQHDPATLKTDRVQFWTYGGTMAGMIGLDRAKKLVATGVAIACTDQSISQARANHAVSLVRALYRHGV